MEQLYFQADKLVKEVQQQFLQLSELKCHNENTAPVQNNIAANLELALNHCYKLESLIQREPPSRRQNIRVKVNQLKLDISHLQGALNYFEAEKLRKQKEEDERNLLLNTQFTTNRSYPNTILIDHSINHHNSLQNTHRGMDDLIGSGTSILENLRNQRSSLKNIQRRFMDIANILGLSNTTMRLIERRAREDKFIFYGGIFVTLLVICLVILYLT